MNVYRKATGRDHASLVFAAERHGSQSELSQSISDQELLHVFELRAPYTFVQFSRLRLSIRIFNRAPAELLVLLWEARKGARS